MATVFDAAQYILSSLAKDGHLPITTWKLQKLVYHSQAWAAVWDDEPIFSEQIQAWANGPVCPALYDLHRGQFKISELPIGNSKALSRAHRKTVDAVLEHYGKRSADYLSRLTHEEEPWKKARRGLKPGERGNYEITVDFDGGVLRRPVTKRPKSKVIPAPKKAPKEAKPPFLERLIHEGSSVVLRKEAVSLPLRSRMDLQMAWTTEKKDTLGRWTWGQFREWGKPLWRKTLLPFLLQYERKRWSDIEFEMAGRDRRFKTYEIPQICVEAQNRLQELGIDDLDYISRFRLGSKPRLYGFICQHVFFILWWDPEHRIYPSDIQDRGKNRRR